MNKWNYRLFVATLFFSAFSMGCAVRGPISGKKILSTLEPKMVDVNVSNISQNLTTNQSFFFMHDARSVMPQEEFNVGSGSDMSASAGIAIFKQGINAAGGGAVQIANTLASKNREVFTVAVIGESSEVKEIAKLVTMSKLIAGTNVVAAFNATTLTGEVQVVDVGPLDDLVSNLGVSVSDLEDLTGLLDRLGVDTGSDDLSDLIDDLLDPDVIAFDPDAIATVPDDLVADPPSGGSTSNLIKESTHEDRDANGRAINSRPSGRGAVVLIDSRFTGKIESVTVGGISFNQSTDFTRLPNGKREHWRHGSSANNFNGETITVELKDGKIFEGRIEGSGGRLFRGGFDLKD